jgi:8-hydroxy-5-deazaflavin:NADPH oxidoreductase
MRIAIIGRGTVGSALGRAWTDLGHAVVYGVRQPGAGDEASVSQACAGAEVVVLATPWDAVEAALAAAGDLSGRILIDCTNPLEMRDGRLRLALGHATSGGEIVAARARGASVFKTLNQTGAETLGDAGAYAVPPVMFVAGDDPIGKSTVLGLVAELGFDAVDGGPLENARLLEPLAMLWIDQAYARGAGRHFSFARITPRAD